MLNLRKAANPQVCDKLKQERFWYLAGQMINYYLIIRPVVHWFSVDGVIDEITKRGQSDESGCTVCTYAPTLILAQRWRLPLYYIMFISPEVLSAGDVCYHSSAVNVELIMCSCVKAAKVQLTVT